MAFYIITLSLMAVMALSSGAPAKSHSSIVPALLQGLSNTCSPLLTTGYGCWNSDARDTDLCKICSQGNFRMVSSKLPMSAVKIPAVTDGTHLSAWAHGVLYDICKEMEYSFSYGCWNSNARDTDLCKICVNSRQVLQPLGAAYWLKSQAMRVVASRGYLSDACDEMDHSFSYGCWNSDASDTDLCKICRSMSRQQIPSRQMVSGNTAVTKVQDLDNRLRTSFSSLCSNFNAHYSYGCWNSDARNTDLCKICSFLHLIVPQRAAIHAGVDQNTMTKSNVMALNKVARDTLDDICSELGSFFSYGCWNSDARDTDLCNICKSM